MIMATDSRRHLTHEDRSVSAGSVNVTALLRQFLLTLTSTFKDTMRSTGWVTECGLKRLTESEAIKAEIATRRKSVSNSSRSALAVTHLVMWAAECFSDLSETLTVLQTRPSLCTPWNTRAGEFLQSQTNVSGSCRDWWIIGAPATDHLTWSISRQEISSNLEECYKLGHAVYIFYQKVCHIK